MIGCVSENDAVGIAHMYLNIPYGRLIKKVKTHGIQCTLASSFQNWLGGRRHRVIVQGCFCGGRCPVSTSAMAFNVDDICKRYGCECGAWARGWGVEGF